MVVKALMRVHDPVGLNMDASKMIKRGSLTAAQAREVRMQCFCQSSVHR